MDEVKSYILRALKKKRKKEEIKALLLSHGHRSEEVELSFKWIHDRDVKSARKAAIWSIILCFLFFIPFAPLVALILAIFSITKGTGKQNTLMPLAIIACIISIFTFIISSFFFLGVVAYFAGKDLIEAKFLSQSLDENMKNANYTDIIEQVNLYYETEEPNKHNFYLLHQRGRSYLELGNNSRAILDYEETLPFIEELEKVEQQEFTYVYYNLGYLYLRELKPVDSIESYSMISELLPRNSSLRQRTENELGVDVSNVSGLSYVIYRLTLDDLRERDEQQKIIDLVNEYFNNYTLEDHNFNILIYKGSAQSQLNQTKGAIESFESMLPFISNLGNVEQSDYADTYFVLSFLYSDIDNEEQAIDYFDKGLVIKPDSKLYQIHKGHLFEELGDSQKALSHYQDLLDQTSLSHEDRIIVQMKINRLKGENSWSEEPLLDSYYQGYTVRLFPIGRQDDDLPLEEMCLLIKSKFRVDCIVVGSLFVNETKTYNEERNQYNSKEMILDLERWLNKRWQQSKLLSIGITDKDLYTDDLNFVFATTNGYMQIGVVSKLRFDATLFDTPEKQRIIERRLGIQLLSSVGRLIGYPRPSNSKCPLANVLSVENFAMKSSKFCDSSMETQAKMMEIVKDKLVPFSTEEKQKINEVYKEYYYE